MLDAPGKLGKVVKERMGQTIEDLESGLEGQMGRLINALKSMIQPRSLTTTAVTPGQLIEMGQSILRVRFPFLVTA